MRRRSGSVTEEHDSVQARHCSGAKAWSADFSPHQEAWSADFSPHQHSNAD
jgi:hypothetical protein